MVKSNNKFEAYQEAKQKRREGLIIQYLGQLQKSKVKVPHLTALAEMVAFYIAEQEQGPCSKTTLLRNKRYKKLLLNFMVSHSRGMQNVRAHQIEDEKARLLVTSAQLENENLRREIARLKAHISHLVLQQGDVARALVNDDAKQIKDELQEMTLMYVRTCQTLWGVLEHTDGFLSIDVEQRVIVDRTLLRNNVVVEPEYLGPFIDWMHSNKNILAGGG